MKRIVTILLVVLMVFSITGCDPAMRANLANFMGSMGHNIMGTDTSAVGDIVANTKVNAEDVQKAEDVLDKQADGSAKVEVAPGIQVTIPKEEAEKIESVLPPMKAKEETISSIGAALKTEAGKDKLVADMKEPVKEEAVQKAAQGTAIVMKNALAQAADMVKEDDVPADMKETVKSVKDALANVSESLESISKDPKSVSQADVVTLQLVNDFVETVNKNVEQIKSGNVPAEVLTDANNLFTVTSALSEASKFNPNTLIGAVVSGLPSSASESKAMVARAATNAKPVPELKIPAEAQTIAKTMYDAVANIVSGRDFAQTKSGLGFHKMSYENYASMVAGKVNLKFVNQNDEKETVEPSYLVDSEYLITREFTEFKTFTGLTQYAVATLFSEGDDFYQVLKAKVADHYHIDVSKFSPDIAGLVRDFAAVNPWIRNPEDHEVELYLPENYQSLLDLKENYEAFFKYCGYVMSGRNAEGNLVEGQKQYFRTAVSTINNMVVFTDLSSISSIIGDNDLHYILIKYGEKTYVVEDSDDKVSTEVEK